MKEHIQTIQMKERDLFNEARALFIRYSGLDLSKEKHQRMMETACQAREAGLSGIDVRASVSRWDGACLSGGVLSRKGHPLECRAFSQIADDAVQCLYAFVVTAGECIASEDDPITAQLFAHTWGTAYVDAARRKLEGIFRDDIQRSFPDCGLLLSPYYGPGFYGMPMTENQRLCGWLNADAIGVTTKENGLMLPLKSCSGLYMALADSTAIPPESCEACIGNAKGCAYCRNRKEERE